MASSRAFLDGLALLARRELSERQLRQRLVAKKHPPDEVDAAIDRLKAERALDDERVAAAIARVEAARKGRGRRRVRTALEQAGIDRDTARRATDACFENVDEDAHLAVALDKRLHGGGIDDEAQFRRLYRHLVGQGFESARILALLKARRRR